MNSYSPSTLFLLLVALLSAALEAHAQALRSLSESEGSAASHSETAGASASHEAKVESPSTVSFTGPLVAGALAIVLIGAVVKFRTRTAAQ